MTTQTTQHHGFLSLQLLQTLLLHPKKVTLVNFKFAGNEFDIDHDDIITSFLIFHSILLLLSIMFIALWFILLSRSRVPIQCIVLTCTQAICTMRTYLPQLWMIMQISFGHSQTGLFVFSVFGGVHIWSADSVSCQACHCPPRMLHVTIQVCRHSCLLIKRCQ